MMIRIYDDTGRNDDFFMEEILFENDNVILGLVINEWYTTSFEVLIYKDTKQVISKNLLFYYANI